jgi:hypothetical protein
MNELTLDQISAAACDKGLVNHNWRDCKVCALYSYGKTCRQVNIADLEAVEAQMMVWFAREAK